MEKQIRSKGQKFEDSIMERQLWKLQCPCHTCGERKGQGQVISATHSYTETILYSHVDDSCHCVSISDFTLTSVHPLKGSIAWINPAVVRRERERDASTTRNEERRGRGENKEKRYFLSIGTHTHTQAHGHTFREGEIESKRERSELPWNLEVGLARLPVATSTHQTPSIWKFLFVTLYIWNSLSNSCINNGLRAVKDINVTIIF